MPWVEITTREPLADDVRANLARSISDTMETIEFGHPTENARKVDWMWFHTLPANMWAVGGQFDDTYVRGRKLAFARIMMEGDVSQGRGDEMEALFDGQARLKDTFGIPK
jgi:hypothetical protein